MNLKTSYIILIILFVFCTIGFLFFRERVLFFFYGYQQSLINADTAESFAAFKKIVLGKKIFLVISILLSIGCLTISYNIRKNEFGFNQHLASVFFYISLIVSIIFLVGFALALIIPTRLF